ncbi:MAG: LamG domain-containing protein, partial [bacterium]
TASATAWYVGAVPLEPLMALYLPMEGGATNALSDFSGNGITAVTHGDPAWLPNGGHDGNGAWEFDGSGDDLSGGDNFPAGQSYTKTAWVYRTGSGQNGGNNIISGDQDPNGHALWAPDSYGNRLSGGHNANWDIVQDDVALALNTWYFVALSYDAATHHMKLFKNGVMVDSALVAPADQTVADQTISIGSFGASNGWMWQGRIDDARVWNRALSKDQILSLYAAGENVIKWSETEVGDDWQARVTAFTASDVGSTAMSDTVTIVSEIPAPPVIVSIPD